MVNPGGADVIVDFTVDGGLLFVSVANIGDRPAHDVATRFDQDFRGAAGDRAVGELPLFRQIPFLAPRKEIRTFVDSLGAYLGRGEPTVVTAEISWQTDDGARRERRVRHDLDIYRDLADVR